MTDFQPEPTIGRLIAEISSDMSSLVKHEIALAKSELKISVKASGWGIAFIAIAAFLGLMVLILGSITIALLLTFTGLHAAWAFGIVTLFYLLVAVVLVVLAYFKFKKVRMPEKTIETAQAIPEVFRQG